jgi:putative ABC transport system permease protein
VAAIAQTLERQYPETNKNRRMVVQTVLRYRTSKGVGRLAIMLLTLAGAVLLVACLNVAGLLTSRAAERAREIAMRLALGAGRARLIRQLLTESLLLAAAGGVAGLGIGYLPLLVLRRMIREILPNESSQVGAFFRLDERALLFSVGVALLSVVLFGLAPAFQATRTELSGAMKGGAIPPRRRGPFRNRMLGRSLLVAGQVAISVLLLTVSSLIYVTFRSVLVAVGDAGFPTDHVLTMTFDPIVTHYKDAQARQFYRQLMERLRSMTGVASVTLGSQAQTIPVRPDGYQSLPGSSEGPEPRTVFSAWAGDNFFDALAIPVLRGRGFRNTDSAGGAAVAVVNESLAELYWPGQDAVGKRIRVDEGMGRWVEVVGVAAIKNYEGLIVIPSPRLIFFPAAQNPKHPPLLLFARSAGDRTALVKSLRGVVRELDPAQAIPEVHPWRENLEMFRRGLRLATQVIGAMGAMGMVLALVGLYGLVAYDVSTRTREIGIRMALGAARGSVSRMVLRQGLALAACGIGVGLLLNYGVAHSLMALGDFTQPGGVKGIDVEFSDLSYAALMLAVLGLTMLAAYIPARRAARVDPNVALRCE